MTMKTIKVAKATERQLNWLVARIEGDELPKSGGKGWTTAATGRAVGQFWSVSGSPFANGRACRSSMPICPMTAHLGGQAPHP